MYLTSGLCNLHGMNHALKDCNENCESSGWKRSAFIPYHIIRVFPDPNMRLGVIGWVERFTGPF